MALNIPAGKDTGVNCRVQSFYPAVKALGETCNGGNIGYGDFIFL